jgi:hypothetical protein
VREDAPEQIYHAYAPDALNGGDDGRRFWTVATYGAAFKSSPLIPCAVAPPPFAPAGVMRRYPTATIMRMGLGDRPWLKKPDFACLGPVTEFASSVGYLTQIRSALSYFQQM